MTIRIPKWLLAVFAVVLVGGAVAGAYLIGQSSGGDDGAETVEAGDEVEDSAASTGPEAQPAPCDERAAKEAALTAGFADRIETTAEVQKQMAGVSESDFPSSVPQAPFWDEIAGYRVAILECADLTGDEVEEMVLAPSAGAGGNMFNWAVFTPDDSGEWQLAFSREAHQISDLKLREGTITEEAPTFEEGDPSCCPSAFRTSEISYRDGRFVLVSPTAEPGQREISFSTDGTPLRLGEIDVQQATPDDARAQLGTPNSIISTDPEVCVQSWSDLGLRITFANLGGADACGRKGAVGSFDLVGSLAEQAGWVTDDGAKVGMNANELRGIYPEAMREGDEMTLIQRPSPFGEGGVTTSLSAYLGDGQALGYRVFVGAAGE